MNLLRHACKVLALALVSGCGPKPAASPPAPATTNAKAAPWRSFELPMRGIGASFPETPRLNVHGFDEGKVHIELQELGLEKDGMVYDLAAFEFSSEGRPLPQTEESLARFNKLYKTIKQRREVTLDGYPGVEIRGLTPEGKERLIRYYVVGGSLLTWASEATPDKFSEALARRFVEGSSFELPWRIYSTPEGRFSVSVPRLAAEVPREQLGWQKNFKSGVGFLVGGKKALFYAAGSMERPSPDPRTDDEVADQMTAALAQKGELLYTAPLNYEGARARDILAILDGVPFRIRLIVTAHYGYLMMVGANDKAAVLDNSQQRFFSSLRWYQEGD